MAKQDITGPPEDPTRKYEEQKARVGDLVKALKGIKPGAGKIAELEEELRRLREENEAYKRAEEDWDIEKRKFEKELGGYKDLKKDYKEVEADRRVLGERVGELEADNKDLEGKLGGLNGQIGDLRGNLTNCGKLNDNYAGLMDELLDALEEFVRDNYS